MVLLRKMANYRHFEGLFFGVGGSLQRDGRNVGEGSKEAVFLRDCGTLGKPDIE